MSTTDTAALGAGQTWSNVQTSVHFAKYANFVPGTETWFSSCGSGGPYASDIHFAVYEQGNLVTAHGTTTPLCRAPEFVQIQNYIDTDYYTENSRTDCAPSCAHCSISL